MNRKVYQLSAHKSYFPKCERKYRKSTWKFSFSCLFESCENIASWLAWNLSFFPFIRRFRREIWNKNNINAQFLTHFFSHRIGQKYLSIRLSFTDFLFEVQSVPIFDTCWYFLRYFFPSCSDFHSWYFLCHFFPSCSDFAISWEKKR